MKSLPASVRIVEVGPRDGLQNEEQSIDLQTKLKLIQQLVAAGLRTIEAGSFVNPERVPQMAGSDELFIELLKSPSNEQVTLTALTPNLKGLDRAIVCGVTEVAVFAAATESFSQKNINCSIAESLQRFTPLVNKARDHGIAVRGYVSCAFGCPYEGRVEIVAVRELTQQLLDMGCYEVSLGDTIGVATANQISELLDNLKQTITVEQLALHLHDTYGQAIANAVAGLEAGVQVFDTSVAGLGGCPFAPGASGNVATEDFVYLLDGLGIKHGIDYQKLIDAGVAICHALNRPYGSKAGAALLSKRNRS